MQGDTTRVKGTIQFTGTFTIAATGQFKLDPNASVQFADVTLSAGSRTETFVLIEDKSEERIAVTGTLTIPDGESVRLPLLVVSKSFTLKGGTKAGKTSEFRVGGSRNDITMTVHSGATLRINGVDLVVHLRKEMLVEGTIEDVTKGTRHPLRIAFLNTSSTGDGSRRNGPFLRSTLYRPRSGGFDTSDCKRIRGKGTIPSGIFAIATSNLCVELKRVGPVTASGSIQNDVHTQAKITTDLIFREDVIVEGDVAQWNDARIVFEKTVTIQGDVILRDGGTPYTNTADYGEANIAADSGVRPGWQLSDNKWICEYSNARRRDSWDYDIGTYHIPGVQFEGAATIAGDMNVYSSTLTETVTATTKATSRCAPRVVFMAPLVQDDAKADLHLVSSVGGSLVVEDTVSFGGKGRVYLDSDAKTVSGATRRTAHSLRVGLDLAVGGQALGMAYPSTSNVDGMCTGEDISLMFGNRIELTDAGESVIIGDATNGLMLDALVAHGDLGVEPGKGTLSVKTLHVGPRAELMSTKDVKVTESLILQGELSGELDEASTIKRLTYGNRNTDVVKKAALHTMLDALAIHVGSGEIRLDEVVKTKNLGLCSGTLSLADAESTTDSTLHVTGQITVQNGMLEKDANDPGSISTDRNRYLLKYITPGKRTVTDALEWFAPQDVVVDHAKAEIMVNDDRSVSGKLEVSSGMLMMEDSLNAGSIVLGSATKMGTLQTEGEDVVVNGKVTVNGKSKLMTGGGDLHVLGTVRSGAYTHNTAQVSIAKDAMIHLGDGTLMLGPEDTKKRNNLRDLTGYNTGTDGSGANSRPDVKLTLTGSLTAGMIKVPKGSKETVIDASSDSKMLGTVVFDGTKTPKLSGTTENDGGLLRILSATAAGKMLTIDTLSAMQGAVETHNKKVVITKDVALTSATIWPYAETTEFMGDLMISGTGGLNTQHNQDGDKRSVMIHGDFTQTKGMVSGDVAGVKLHPMTTKTVMGDLMVAADASRYEGEMASGNMPSLMVHGGFHFAKNGKLNVKVEFTGKEAQEVMTGDTTALHSVTVNNAKGLLLKSHVMQQKMATLTLRQGKIHSMPMDSMFMWTVQNVQAEQELRGRSTAQEGEKCGADNDEECKATILRGSRQSYVGGPVNRHLAQGNAGAGFASGGYLFPVGMEKGDMSHYRPLILQLPSDLIDTTAATVSPMMVPDGAMPAWQNLTVPTAGGSLTLDVHADLFWKVDLGTESLPTNTNLRIAAAGLQNVADASGLRIVQWDCMWKNPKLAGRRPGTGGGRLLCGERVSQRSAAPDAGGGWAGKLCDLRDCGERD